MYKFSKCRNGLVAQNVLTAFSTDGAGPPAPINLLKQKLKANSKFITFSYL